MDFVRQLPNQGLLQLLRSRGVVRAVLRHSDRCLLLTSGSISWLLHVFGNFQARGMLNASISSGHDPPGPQLPPTTRPEVDEDDDGGAVDGDILGEVTLRGPQLRVRRACEDNLMANNCTCTGKTSIRSRLITVFSFD